MIPEAPPKQTEDRACGGRRGWFVLNARDARWNHRPGRQSVSFTGKTEFEADTYFPMLGVNLAVLEPGEPNSMYHWETETEAFLVISGEALLIVEGEERPLKQWDFALLDSDEISALVAELDDLRWTGRRGYGARTLLGACLVRSLYAIPTWTRTTRLIAEHAALQSALGGAPSEWACYRFSKKLRENRPALNACLDALAASLRDQHPEMGKEIAIDATDLPAYANGQKYDGSGERRKPFSDPDAAWGFRSAVSTRRGGGFYGYKLHAAVCAVTGLPLAWRIESGNRQETAFALPLLDAVSTRGFSPEACAFDKGYDHRANYEGCETRGVRPIIPLRKLGKDSEPLACEHGSWTFAGADFKRGASKWRCPTGECQPKSKWVRADRRNPLVPRETRRWRNLYRGRAAIEREFGRLKNEYGLAPLRVRGIERVALHADLVMLARLSQALARARVVPLAA